MHFNTSTAKMAAILSRGDKLTVYILVQFLIGLLTVT